MSTANNLRAEGRIEDPPPPSHQTFGPLPATFVDRVRAGTATDLDRWADAVLSAPTLDAVFAE